MKWIGLTGGIATGKSTVARLIESRGYKVIDADQVSHQVTQIQSEGYDRILSYFGEDILDDRLNIDRKKLGQVVFESASKKEQLESFLHPLIREEVQSLKDKYKSQGVAVVFYDVPLLFEKNMESDFDMTVVVWCDAATQLQRLIKRSRLTEVEALLRINAQLPLSYKIKRADFCIDNSGPDYELIQAVDYFLENL